MDELVADMKAGKYGRIDHFLVIRNGYIVVDQHFERDYEKLTADRQPVDHQYDYDHPKWHPWYQGGPLHTLQSVTKSITSIAVGIAIDEGHIPDGVRTPATAFFDSWKTDQTDGRRQAMTLEDMLTMRSGLQWDEWTTSYDDADNSCIQLESSDDWIRFVLEQPMSHAPGTRFVYNSGVSVLLGKIVREATGQRIDHYLRDRLFQPL